MPTYKYSDIKSIINTRLHSKIGMLPDIRSSINYGIRRAWSAVDLRSAKRSAPMAPNLFPGIFDYSCPIDVKGIKAVDFQQQGYNRSQFQDWALVSDSQFDQVKKIEPLTMTFSDRSFIRKLRVSVGYDSPGQTLMVDLLDSISGNGTWTTNGDATNLTVDGFNFLIGNASLKFDISATPGVTAGIQNSTLNVFDITAYYQNGSVFAYAYITDPTNITGYTIQLGSDSNNYYQMSTTQTNEGTAFYVGWNLLRFDFNGSTPVNTPVQNQMKFCSIFMNKASGKVSSSSYRFDGVQIKLGFIYNFIYYSKYPWQSSSGSWQPNSLADTDYINADEDEVNLLIEAAVEECAHGVNEESIATSAANKYSTLKAEYIQNFPSDAITQTDSYYDFASIDGDDYSYGVQSQ